VQKTVLIVEDEFLIAMDLKLLLEHHGWRVMGPVATVRDALRLLEDELPSVALLDVNLGNELVTPVADSLKREMCLSPWQAPMTSPSKSAARFWLEHPISGNRLASDSCWARWRN
jgi:CheY-like chemotaxis protein